MRTRRHSITLCVSKFKSDNRKQFFMLWIVNLWYSNSLTFSYLRSLDYLESGLNENNHSFGYCFETGKHSEIISLYLESLLEYWRAFAIWFQEHLWWTFTKICDSFCCFMISQRAAMVCCFKSSPTVAYLFSCPRQRIVVSMPPFLWGLE